MSIRRKLTDRLSSIQPTPEVTITIPEDPAAAMVKGAAAVAATVQSLVDERSDLQNRNENLMRQLVFLRNTIARVEGERDHWRKQAAEYIRYNGQLAGVFGGMVKLAESANSTLLCVQSICDQMPIEQPALPSFDENGIPLDRVTETASSAPTISLEELRLVVERPTQGE